jgi:hypothetical protein
MNVSNKSVRYAPTSNQDIAGGGVHGLWISDT